MIAAIVRKKVQRSEGSWRSYGLNHFPANVVAAIAGKWFPYDRYHHSDHSFQDKAFVSLVLCIL